jgi:hypothetical protein
MIADFEAIGEDPEKFKAFVNAAEAGVEVARAKQKRIPIQIRRVGGN